MASIGSRSLLSGQRPLSTRNASGTVRAPACQRRAEASPVALPQWRPGHSKLPRTRWRAEAPPQSGAFGRDRFFKWSDRAQRIPTWLPVHGPCSRSSSRALSTTKKNGPTGLRPRGCAMSASAPLGSSRSEHAQAVLDA